MLRQIHPMPSSFSLSRFCLRLQGVQMNSAEVNVAETKNTAGTLNTDADPPSLLERCTAAQ